MINVTYRMKIMIVLKILSKYFEKIAKALKSITIILVRVYKKCLQSVAILRCIYFIQVKTNNTILRFFK